MATTKSQPQLNDNQYKYLTNLAGGKTATGGVANAGQQSWAKQQLAGSVYTPPMPTASKSQMVSSAPKPPAGVVPTPVMPNTAPKTTNTAPMTPITKPATTTVPTPAMPQSRTETTLGTMNDKINADPFQFVGPSAFTYDPNTDPAYQAALKTAQANITQQQADTGAALRAGGQGKSSYSEQVANQIGAKEMARVSSEVVPQLVSQAYQRYADQANRDLQVQQNNYGAQQDQIGNLGNLYGLQDKQDFQNPITEGQLTGDYKSGDARALYNTVTQAKSEYATAAAKGDRTAMQAANEKANAARSQLQTMGYDTSGFNANTTLDTALRSGAPSIRTLGGQQQDLAEKDFNVNTALQYGDRTGEVYSPQDDPSGYVRQNATGKTAAGTDVQQSLGGRQQDVNEAQAESSLTSEQQQRELATREAAMQEWQIAGSATPNVAAILGVPAGTLTSDQAYKDAGIQLDKDKLTFNEMQAKADAQNQQTQQQKSISATDAGNLLSSALQKVVGYTEDANGNKTVPKYGTITDPHQREQAFLDLYYNYGVTGNDMISALTKAGYTMKEINALKSDPDYAPIFQ